MVSNDRPKAIVTLDTYDEPINILVYGDSGAGKTVLAGTAPGPALFLSTESGTISAKRQGSTAELWRIEKWEDLVAAFQFLKNENHAYQWVMLDSITEMQTQCLDWILRRAKEENSNRDEDIPAIQDHQKWQNMMMRFVRAINALPVNVLWTALPMRTDDEEAEPLILPLVTGKGYGISQKVCAHMHVVGYLGPKVKADGTEVRRLLVRKTPPYFAKDRYDALGRWIDDPTMPMIVDLIDGKTQPATAPKGK